MKIELDSVPEDLYRIDSYKAGVICINGKDYTSSFIITSERIITDWSPQYFNDLAMQHIEQITALQPEIIILGTGNRLRFPSYEVIAPIGESNIGFEVMDSGAACRCYNLLVSEGRRVAAGIIMLEN